MRVYLPTLICLISLNSVAAPPDSKPYLAQAYAQSEKQTLMLQRMQANCPKGMRRAILFDRRAPLAWFGCWEVKGDKIEIGFEDGDLLSMERERFTWLPETES